MYENKFSVVEARHGILAGISVAIVRVRGRGGRNGWVGGSGGWGGGGREEGGSGCKSVQ